MTNQEIIDRKRAQYLSGAVSHEEYYLWLADSLGIGAWALPVSIETLRKSTDPHFNDITLWTWDKQHETVRRAAGAGGARSWSLSDTVCVLKAIARREVSK